MAKLLGWVLAAVVAAAVVGCLFRSSWVFPPDDGEGPFVSPAQEHRIIATAVVGGSLALVFAIVGVVMVRRGDDRVVHYGVCACAFVVLTVMSVAPLGFRGRQLDIDGSGFTEGRYRQESFSVIMIYNAGDADVTVCFGIGGDCDPPAGKGSQQLRSPGLRVPAHHRAGVKLGKDLGDFQLTIAEGFTRGRRDAVLHLDPTTTM